MAPPEQPIGARSVMSWSKSQPRRRAATFAYVTVFSVMLMSCASSPTAPLLGSNVAKTPNPTFDSKPVTPLSQYRPVVEQVDGQIALAPHTAGRLSDAQKAAIKTLATKVASLGEGAFIVRIAGPDPENGDAASTAQAAADQLRSLGVASDHITFGRYDAPQAGGPVQVAYNAFIAIGPNCKKGWDDFSATGDNKVTLHFGCATASNLAVMIADPRDLQRPAAETSADATRRINVLNKYRKGETTSASKDEQASGSVSQSVK